MSIKWLDKNFAGPFTIKYWEAQKDPVIFAVMSKPDPKNSPTSYRILFFGQSGSLKTPKYFTKHRKIECWTNFANSFEELFVGFHPMPGSSVEERVDAVSKLVEKYKPVCNY